MQVCCNTVVDGLFRPSTNLTAGEALLLSSDDVGRAINGSLSDLLLDTNAMPGKGPFLASDDFGSIIDGSLNFLLDVNSVPRKG